MLQLRSSISAIRPFKNHSNFELLNTLISSQFCAQPYLVNNINKFLSISNLLIGKHATCYYISKTAGKVFSAGETYEELRETLQRLSVQNMGGIIDYCAEGETSTEGLDNNEKAIIQSALCATEFPYPSVAVKVTALIDTALLEKLNIFIEKKLQKGNEKYIRIFNESIFDGLSKEFEEKEIERIEDCMFRLRRIANICKDKNVSMMIDAEQTFFQAAIDSFTWTLQNEYNKNSAIVLNTIQSYLKDSENKLASYLQASKEKSLSLGIKLVRGAYMREENDIALAKGIASPIHDSKEATNYAYHANTEAIFQYYKQGDRLCIASHNWLSAEFAKEKLYEKKIGRLRGGVTFGQLLGMKSMMSASLASENYAVQRYVPFGPSDKLIPYLARRAIEQSQVVGELYEQVKMIREELKIRSNSKY
ncbi:unnamed protein product [Blepharisma stoltei]|uniref:Proline dehydrogenase n=1 Tax=Blepharisma stoltei TaxID=1481888 RepID=A0AAU9J9W6_9CILI|nr:unnamed protein product [Blepharisma stoltei]